MEGEMFETPACSFELLLHQQYETIRADCDAWLLALMQPHSPATVQFWIDNLFPLFSCLADRVLHISKIITWFFVFDSEHDDPAVFGSDTTGAADRRFQHVLACFAGNLLLCDGSDDPSFIKQMQALHEVIQAMLQDVSPLLQTRMLWALREYFNAIIIQGHYRSSRHLPELDEYIALRRSDSLMYLAYQLIEYGLGIELDQETLDSSLFIQLHDAAVDHVALTNDVISCHVEMSSDDQLNLPRVILHSTPDDSFTFKDALQRALSIVEEVDKRFLQLKTELQKTSLFHKPGVEAYVRSLQTCMAGNKEWSLRTIRYRSKLSSGDEGVVSVCRDECPSH